MDLPLVKEQLYCSVIHKVWRQPTKNLLKEKSSPLTSRAAMNQIAICAVNCRTAVAERNQLPLTAYSNLKRNLKGILKSCSIFEHSVFLYSHCLCLSQKGGVHKREKPAFSQNFQIHMLNVSSSQLIFCLFHIWQRVGQL